MFKKNPENSKLKSITRTPIKFATPELRNTIPMNKKIAAAARLKRTRKSSNFKKLGQAGIKPVIGYTTTPRIIGGRRRRGIISNRTLAAKYDGGE